MRFLTAVILMIVISIPSARAQSEEVTVKYGGKTFIDVETYDCPELKPSSFVNRICFNANVNFLIVKLKDAYYHYCNFTEVDLYKWVSAPSLGRFYNANVRGGPFDCRVHGVPKGIYSDEAS